MSESIDALAVLLSVRPPHIDRLLDGSKTIEIRRRPWNVPNGTVVILYASREVKGIVGSLVVAGTHTDSPREVWRRVRNHAGISRAEYDDYLAGASTATAISVDSVRTLDTPIPLHELRLRHPGFVVPQSYRFVGDAEVRRLINGECRQILGRRVHDPTATP